MNKTVLQVGCFGEPGSFSYEAMEKYFQGIEKKESYYAYFEDVVQAVKKQKIQYGVLPIENSSTGGITDVYDLIRRYDCAIVGEKCVKIEHNLMAIPGVALENIREVYSHPQGFAQCKNFFGTHPKMTQIPYFNTSQSAKMVHEKQSSYMAAVAGRRAADLYGLRILAENINMNTYNYTRFFIIANQQEYVQTADKITLVVVVKHEPGSLYKTLGHFYHSGLNMMNIESRPLESRPFEYFFHIDLQGNLKDEKVHCAFEQLKDDCTYYKVLGNYLADKEGV